ncbi:MAG: adenylyl-sulfate kinase, partial [Candidatus Omnitrophota bacterium]|nr:adenylyl-sulfate kinase [Candidatus Omnitrophota bacterium]
QEDEKMKNTLLPPHGGGGLVNRFLPEVERKYLFSKAQEYKSYTISDSDLAAFYRIADGGLSPLEGPMSEEEFHRVLDEENIELNGKKYAWTIPIAFPVSKREKEKLETGETVIIKNEFGIIVGTLEIADIYGFDKKKYNKSVYGTDRRDHPGPRIVNNDPRDYLLGGKIWALPPLNYPAYGKYMLNPEESREVFMERKWGRIVAFQTRNALHRAHEYAMVYALEGLTKEGHFAGAVLNPLVGTTKKDDVPADIRMRTYEALLENKLLGHGDIDTSLWKKKKCDIFDQLVLIGLDIKMYYAGPKEAVMHAIYRQNYGFTDIVIGRKHADAPFDDGTPAWGDFDAQEKFEDLKGELRIRPFKVGFASFFEEIERVGLIDEFGKKGYHPVSISGKELRKKLQNGEPVDERVMRKPVVDILEEFYRKKKAEEEGVKSTNITWHETGISRQFREKKNGHRGTIIWLTGLPSSGKSTIAVELQALLFEAGCNVYLLDGDNVRHGLNKNLGFSPEDREENIRRVGEVAKLFADAGFMIITSFISPYIKDRDSIRDSMAEGDFVEVYVKADVSTCENRDVKGLYGKARRGEIKDFTGVSAPYEEPEDAEVILDTDKHSKEESAEIVFNYLKDKKYFFRELSA